MKPGEWTNNDRNIDKPWHDKQKEDNKVQPKTTYKIDKFGIQSS